MSRTSFDQVICLFLSPLRPRPSYLVIGLVGSISRGGRGIVGRVLGRVVAEIIGGVVVDKFLRVVSLRHG